MPNSGLYNGMWREKTVISHLKGDAEAGKYYIFMNMTVLIDCYG